MTWTVAAGRKGRRWREVVTRGEDVVHALLLETDPAGHFSHLELARADGLWTFHPEGDGTLHGNHVAGTAGVRHIAGRPFEPDDALLVEGSLVSSAAIAWWLATTDLGSSSIGAVVLGVDGTLGDRSTLRVERTSATRWQIGEGSPIEIDDAGLPLIQDGQTWPLEID